jgi:Amt family ammonium transporter
MRAMMAVFNTNIAASTGAIGWALIDYVKHGRRFSVTGICEGIIAGLVGITPAAGYVSVWCAAAIGFITAIVISLLQNINDWIGIDEGMDVFKLHGMGGIVGSFLTGIFATASVSSLDGVTLAPGGIDGNGVQVGKQFAEIASVSSYAFTVSLILCYVLKYVPGMHLRVSDEAETVGLDFDQFFDEQIGDWSLFDHTSGIPQDGKMISTPVTPPPEEEKQDSKV